MTRLALIALLTTFAGAVGMDQGAAQDATGEGAAAQATPPQPVPAQGPDAAPPAETGCYSFHRRGEDFVRLDSQTGQLSQCGWSAIGWSCKTAPDERSALESEIGRLQRENAALKRSLLSRGLDLPAGVLPDATRQSLSKADTPRPPADVPDASRDDSVAGPKMPSEADLDRAMAYIKNVWRRLVEMMIDLQRDIQRKG
ncbi:MAG: hypothetical protein J0H89_05200 [Rhizobiales bacterium]|nr:hypothetical protein [Hyphomicrobiales bacterium]